VKAFSEYKTVMMFKHLSERSKINRKACIEEGLANIFSTDFRNRPEF
jgi:hypothetical protein